MLPPALIRKKKRKASRLFRQIALCSLRLSKTRMNMSQCLMTIMRLWIGLMGMTFQWFKDPLDDKPHQELQKSFKRESKS